MNTEDIINAVIISIIFGKYKNQNKLEKQKSEVSTLTKLGNLTIFFCFIRQDSKFGKFLHFFIQGKYKKIVTNSANAYRQHCL